MEDPSGSLNRFWRGYRAFEDAALAERQTRFTEWSTKLSSNVHYAWLQSRMGLFIKGNDWKPVKITSQIPGDDKAFKKLQLKYRTLFRSETSLNFNLSRAALYRRQKTHEKLQGKPTRKFKNLISSFCLILTAKSSTAPLDIRRVNGVVQMSIPKAVADVLFPASLRKKIFQGHSRSVQEIGDELIESRQSAFYQFVRNWVGGSLIEGKYEQQFVALSIYLFSLEFLKKPRDLENRWQEIRDEFFFKTGDDLLLHCLSVIQAAMFWLYCLKQDLLSDRQVWILNELLPLHTKDFDPKPRSIEIKNLHDRTEQSVQELDPNWIPLKNTRDDLGYALYDALDVPPDLIALCGTGTLNRALVKQISSEFVPSQLTHNIYLLKLVLGSRMRNVFTWQKLKTMFPRTEQKSAKESLSLPLYYDGKLVRMRGENLVLTRLFPIDVNQFRLFVGFCRRLALIGTSEGRPLRFSLVLGNELHRNFYFEEESALPFSAKRKYDLGNLAQKNQAAAIIKGNAGLFQSGEFHLFCHAGQRSADLRTELALSYVVREYPFAERMPVGNLFSAEVLPSGVMRFLYNRAEICRLAFGDWTFKINWNRAGFTRRIADFLKDNGLSKTNSAQERASLLTEIVEGLRQTSKGGIMIICAKSNFDRWKKSYTVRQTETLKSWDDVVLERGQLRLLTELISQDGATFLIANGKSIKAQGKYILYPVVFDKTTNLPTVISKEFMIRQDPELKMVFDRWGTRHLASIGFSSIVKTDALVITVSEDGPISLFYEGLLLRELSLD